MSDGIVLHPGGVVRIQRRHRRTFRQSVALHRLNSDGVEKLQHRRIDSRTAGDDHPQITAEDLQDISREGLHQIEPGFRCQPVHCQQIAEHFIFTLPADLLPDFFVQALYQNRHAQEHGGPHLLQVLLDIPQTLTIGDGRSFIKGHQETAGTLVGVMNRQDREEDVGRFHVQKRRCAHQVVTNVCVGQHDTLGNTGGSGSVEDDRHIVSRNLRIQELPVALADLLLPFPDQFLPGENLPIRIRLTE